MNKKEVGKRIKKIRINLGLTMDEFGQKVGQIANQKSGQVKSGVVSNWENGKQLPNKKRLKIIADLGDISVDDLLRGEENELYEAGKIIYEDLLEYYDKRSHAGKALRYFSEKETEELIINGIKHLLSVPFFAKKRLDIHSYMNEYQDIKDTTLFMLHARFIRDPFVDKYVEEVKTNSNTIYQTIKKLEEVSIDVSRTENINSYMNLYHKLSDDSLLVLKTTDIPIHPNLLKELTDKTNSLIKEYKELYKKYPDTIYGRTFDFKIHTRKKLNPETPPVDNIGGIFIQDDLTKQSNDVINKYLEREAEEFYKRILFEDDPLEEKDKITLDLIKRALKLSVDPNKKGEDIVF